MQWGRIAKGSNLGQSPTSKVKDAMWSWQLNSYQQFDGLSIYVTGIRGRCREQVTT